MRAARLHEQGGAAVVRFEEAPLPVLREGDALVRVRATGITPAELGWSATYENPDGTPRIPSIPGHEVCGVVEGLAPGASGVAIGDEVYGLTSFVRDGSAAEFVATAAATLAPKPRTLGSVETASVPLSALTAWQALVVHARLAPRQTVLVHGGAGGVGVFAIQLGRALGARVITTASAANHDFVRGLGADEVIDYNEGPFEEQSGPVDVVLDGVGGDTLARSFRVVRDGGCVISLVDPIPEHLRESKTVRSLFFVVEPDRDALVEIARRIDAGELRTVVGRVLPLARAREAFELASTGHNRGKTVLEVA